MGRYLLLDDAVLVIRIKVEFALADNEEGTAK